jgi:hydroxymethylpyrimidine kinase/phosphomethylpyrimidine kinase/thiamine-phosphate diphosphorylase
MPWIPQGEANLAYWCHVLEEPVVAIAGMDATRSQAAMRCGAAGVAVLRALTAEADMAEAVTRLQTAIAEGARAPRETPPELPTPTLPGPVPLVV